MAMVFRETRPDEVTDAVMFVMSGGQAVEAGSVQHDLSHVAQQDGEVIGAVVLGRDADGQETITVHSTPPPEVSLEDSEMSSENPSPESPASGVAEGVCDAGELARQLLDMTLMKLREAGVRTARLGAESGLAERIWSEASWLDRLPVITAEQEAASWLKGLRAKQTDAVAVVETAWRKIEGALSGLDGPGDAEKETGAAVSDAA